MLEILKIGIWIVACLCAMALISGSFEDRSIKKGKELVRLMQKKYR